MSDRRVKDWSSFFLYLLINENFNSSICSDCPAHERSPSLCPERSEPSSRAFLIGEQPNPWDLLQPQDKTSRHRGAELRRRYELLGGTSLLSLE